MFLGIGFAAKELLFTCLAVIYNLHSTSQVFTIY